MTSEATEERTVTEQPVATAEDQGVADSLAGACPPLPDPRLR